MKELRTLKPSHRNAIRLIAVGMPVKDAADLIGVSATYMSTVYRSRQGQEFALALYAMANEYTARMLALGLMPRHFQELAKWPECRKRRVRSPNNGE